MTKCGRQFVKNGVRAWALLAALMIASCGTGHAGAPAPAPVAEIVRLWPGAAPGTEGWSGEEVELDADVPGAGKVHVVTNVTTPTITVFRPPAGKANGAAMLVLPGGAFRALVWDLDGTEVAEWLNRRGVTAFVLRYRVRPPTEQGPGGPESFDAFFTRTQPARDIAVADARRALAYVRTNAARYGIAGDRVGAIGFSAGAMATMELALGSDLAVRPDFAAAVYGAMPSDAVPPAGAPPVFIVAALDDPQVLSTRSLDIYRSWTAAKQPAELHLYEKGGHGFGIRTRNQPTDRWRDAFEAWLIARGLANAPAVK
ncbi:MAG TPA: alpha/beta hydrolase [Allosphingosinicella sp.]|jgi:acetyl esterase/lipase